MARKIPTLRQTIEIMEAAARAVLQVMDDNRLPRDTCILHSRALMIALAGHNVPCRELPLKVIVMDPQTAAVHREGGDFNDVQGGKIYSIGHSGNPSTETTWTGHMAVAVRDRFIVDLSLDQVNARIPELKVPRLLATDAPDFVKGRMDAGEFPLPNDGIVVYQHHPDHDPYIDEWWFDFADQHTRRRLTEITAKHLRALRGSPA